MTFVFDIIINSQVIYFVRYYIMWYIFWIIILCILILSAFLYSMLKEENKINTQQKTFKFFKWNDDVVSLVKTSLIDENLFSWGLRDISIKDDTFLKIKEQLRKKIVWMDEFLNSILVNMLVGWHVLVEWVPWLAKTKTIDTLAYIFDMDFKRIQFTPDMLPSDIVWVEIFNSVSKNFEIKRWPVFANILLADEINRTTPKVQSALLEAMQEKKVTIWGEDFDLPKPFFVLATQNPIEQEWTYSLPEAQIDRFLFKVLLEYPSIEEEKQILDTLEQENQISLMKVLDAKNLLKIQEKVSYITVSQDIKDYISRLVSATRVQDSRIFYWASPRASIWLMMASKAVAYLEWRDYVTHHDVQRLCLSIMRHRIILSYDAKIDWFNEDKFLLEVLPTVTLE